VGNTRRILVSELSGVSNIVATAGVKFGIAEDRAAQKKILQALMNLENRGYQFEAGDASFELLVKRLAGKFTPHFELEHYHITVETDQRGLTKTEASVKLRVGGRERHEVAEGDGPVNALDAALRKALNGHYPTLRGMHLVDYKVRVINSDAGTAAAVRVVIESQDEDGRTWGTVGVHENVITASWDALVDSIEYKLCRDEG
jgi:2-isopropylmalate synthase